MENTQISISEKSYATYKCNNGLLYMPGRGRIVIHDGWQYRIGEVHDENQLKEVLEFLEVDLIFSHEFNHELGGNIKYYNLSKNINDHTRGFRSVNELKEISKGKKLKQFKGLSNASIVDCYIGIGEDTIDIYRPNPNDKDVYKPLPIDEHIKFTKTHWYL